MISFKSIIACLLFQVLLTSFCSGQTVFYVDGASGNDAGSGLSQATAWKTIQKAFDNATPGSIVYISAGIYHEQPELNVSGTPGNPVVFTAAPGAEVFIDGTGMGGSTMISIIDQSHILLQNLTIRNLTRNFAVGILVEASQNGGVKDVAFKNLIITNISWTNDPTIMPGAGNNSNPFLFYGTGITAAAAISGIVVDSCTIFNNITGYSENLTLNGNVDGAVISGNRIHHNKNIGICIAGNYNACSVPALDHARNIHITGNSVYYNISQAATSAGIYVDGGRKVLIERNETYHNGVGIEIGCERDGLTDSCIVRDNLVYDNLDWGIGVGGYDPSTTGQVLYTSVTNNTLYRNTVNNSGIGEFYMPKASHCSFTNNIISTSDQKIFLTFAAISPQENNFFDYNCWYAPGNDAAAAIVNWRGQTLQSFSAYQVATGYDQHSFYGEPMFRNPGQDAPDFRLQEGSPCINTGDPAIILPSGETDFGGFSRRYDGFVDIGAFEYQGVNGIGEWPSGQELMLFPNPCNKVFYLAGLEKGSVIRLFDVPGNQVKEFATSAAGYNVSGLPSGIYFLKVITGEKITLQGKLLISPVQ